MSGHWRCCCSVDTCLLKCTQPLCMSAQSQWCRIVCRQVLEPEALDVLREGDACLVAVAGRGTELLRWRLEPQGV